MLGVINGNFISNRKLMNMWCTPTDFSRTPGNTQTPGSGWLGTTDISWTEEIFKCKGHSNNKWHFIGTFLTPRPPLIPITTCIFKTYYKHNIVAKEYFLIFKALKQCFEKQKLFMWHLVDPLPFRVSRIIWMAPTLYVCDIFVD